MQVGALRVLRVLPPTYVIGRVHTIPLYERVVSTHLHCYILRPLRHGYPPSYRLTLIMYRLYYWPIPGRGEFIRLLLEFAQVPYKDVARDCTGGMPAIVRAKSELPNALHFALPILEISDNFSISQTPVICAYLARRHGLMPAGNNEYIAMQIDHTVHDIVFEVHATHHPVDISITYDEQKSEANRTGKAYVVAIA